MPGAEELEADVDDLTEVHFGNGRAWFYRKARYPHEYWHILGASFPRKGPCQKEVIFQGDMLVFRRVYPP